MRTIKTYSKRAPFYNAFLENFGLDSSPPPPYTPHPMHEFQNKGLAKWAICKRIKIERLFLARKRRAILTA